MIKTALLYDVHVPYHDEDAYDTALKYIKDQNVDRIVLAGDFADFYKVSSWAQDPLRQTFESEVERIREEILSLVCLFPDTPIDYIEGNHEQRLAYYIKKNAPAFAGLVSVPSLFDLNNYNIPYISNIKEMCNGRQPYKLGKLFVLHGHEIRAGYSSVNLARLFYMKAHNSLIVGHHHTSQKYIQRKLDMTYDGAWCVGTLGKLNEPYLPVNNWCHGFAVVDHDPDTGKFDVHNYTIIDGEVKSS